MKKYHLIMTLLMLATSPIYAAEFCVTTSAGLQAALTSAANNSQHDLIKIAEGSYITPGAEFSYYGVNSWDLEISGGWSEFFGNPCGQQVSVSAYDTVLDGDQLNRVLRIRAHGTGDIKISGLMFANGLIGDPYRGGGLYIYSSQNDHLGDITIEKTAFLNNEAKFGGAISMSGGNKIVIRNTLFLINHSLSGANVSIVQNDSAGVYFTNNTMMLNTNDASSSGGLRVYTSGSSNALLANNIMLDNDNYDINILGSGDYYLHHNDLGSREGVTPFSDYGNFNLPPRFDAGLLNFTPSATSPLVNAGRKPCTICIIPVPFDHRWGLGEEDLTGEVRILSDTVDIGAFESPYDSDLIFMHTFD